MFSGQVDTHSPLPRILPDDSPRNRGRGARQTSQTQTRLFNVELSPESSREPVIEPRYLSARVGAFCVAPNFSSMLTQLALCFAFAMSSTHATNCQVDTAVSGQLFCTPPVVQEEQSR